MPNPSAPPSVPSLAESRVLVNQQVAIFGAYESVAEVSWSGGSNSVLMGARGGEISERERGQGRAEGWCGYGVPVLYAGRSTVGEGEMWTGR